MLFDACVLCAVMGTGSGSDLALLGGILVSPGATQHWRCVAVTMGIAQIVQLVYTSLRMGSLSAEPESAWRCVE